MQKDEFIQEVTNLGIIVTNDQMMMLDKYYDLLINWNEKINLTNLIKKEDVYLKHFYDSLTIYKEIDLNKSYFLCDIGTGAGFPGIVLKIFFPTLQITLIDSLLKRVNFLNVVIEELKLEDIKAIHIRAEDYAKINREKYDIVTSRAVAKLPILCEMAIPLLKVNGLFIAMKGFVNEEIVDSEEILKKLDARIIKVISFKLPFENSERSLIKIIKDKKTNPRYPREISKIKKLIEK